MTTKTATMDAAEIINDVLDVDPPDFRKQMIEDLSLDDLEAIRFSVADALPFGITRIWPRLSREAKAVAFVIGYCAMDRYGDD